MNYSFNMDEANLYLEDYLDEWLESHKYKIEENTYYSYKIIVNKITEFFKRKKCQIKGLKTNSNPKVL